MLLIESDAGVRHILTRVLTRAGLRVCYPSQYGGALPPADTIVAETMEPGAWPYDELLAAAASGSHIIILGHCPVGFATRRVLCMEKLDAVRELPVAIRRSWEQPR
ncbi:MAG TPA: hypothetical protein VMN60_02590 [Longimicrobiales bacterium]|nr:hypothetical protein [Longimicrobiales bacterium]